MVFICVYSGDVCDYEIYLSIQRLLFETETLGCTDFREDDKRAFSGWIIRSEEWVW